MCDTRHNLAPLTLEYMPRPADREIRVRTVRADVSGGKERIAWRKMPTRSAPISGS